MKLRVGIVGTSDAWEYRHRPALRALADRFEVRAVCAEVGQRAEQIAHEFHAVSVDGFRSLAARPDLDAILILGSGFYGAMPVFAACDAGKAVYCSASLDIPPDMAREVKERVEQAGIAFMAELPRRHAPATLRLKELIATRLGQPRLLFCHSRVPLPLNAASSYRCGPNAASGLRDLMELVDWCRYVVGSEPTSVVGVEHQLNPSADQLDYQMMSLDFSERNAPHSGALAQISCGRYMPMRWPEAITFRPPAAMQVACDNGIAFIDLPSTLVWFDQAGRQMESLDSERPVGEQLLTVFHRAVTSLVLKTSNLEDAYRALQIVLAARTSSQQGRRVEIEY
jgi:predicted dehydrogenase